MKKTPEQYRDMFLELEPLGPAWTKRVSSRWAKLWLSDGEGFSKLEGEILRLLTEANPLYADAALVDWERVMGLPDECSELGESLETRRGAVIAKLQRPGGQSIDFFLQFLEPFGDVVTVEDDIYPPFLADVSLINHRLWELPTGLLEDGNGNLVVDWYQGWRFVWKITRINHIARWFRAGRETAGNSLVVWASNKEGTDPDLECRINKIKPAHTYVVFEYKTDDEG
jgi:uncharacterized protein YmfQ (DUF2313 family)